MKPRRNRRRPQSVWTRLPNRREIADACGRALRRSLPGIAAVMIVLALGGGVWLGYRFVTSSSRFAIRTIEVRGTTHLSHDEVRAALPVTIGSNIFTANLGTVTTELRSHPWIATASAHRILPDTLVVEITEHRAAALVQLGELYLVDAAGHPFKKAQLEAGEADGLPIVTGMPRATYLRDPDGTASAITHALAALAAWRSDASRPAIGEIRIGTHGSLTLHTYDHGAAIQLGKPGSDFTARLRTFDLAWAELADAERARVRTLHLDARPDHVTVAFAPLATEQRN